MLKEKVLCLFAFFVCASAIPYNNNGYRAVPQRTVMFGSGYYAHPLTRRSYAPQGTMTMFATGGDAVATNSYIGDEYPPQIVQQQDQSVVAEQVPQESVEEHVEDQPEPTFQPVLVPEQEQEQEEEDVAVVPTTTLRPKKTLKRKQKPKTKVLLEDEDEEEDEQPVWPFGSRNVPSYNAFFPISFGIAGRRSSIGRQSLDEEGSYPSGSATAIANSFSTGKGGVASSHATAFGDPALSALFLRKNLQKRVKVVSKDAEE